MPAFSLLPPQSGACTFEETVLCELGNPFKRNQKVTLSQWGCQGPWAWGRNTTSGDD